MMWIGEREVPQLRENLKGSTDRVIQVNRASKSETCQRSKGSKWFEGRRSPPRNSQFLKRSDSCNVLREGSIK